MASWFERNIARPIKDVLKGERAKQQDKQLHEAKILRDEYEKNMSLAGLALRGWKVEQWHTFNAYREHYGQSVLSYSDWENDYCNVGNPLGDYSDSDLAVVIDPDTGDYIIENITNNRILLYAGAGVILWMVFK